MRIWDIPPEELCRQHLLGEHRELHGLWNTLLHNKTGYSRHPETIRWQGKLPALFVRHELLVSELVRRGYNHDSPLIEKVTGLSRQNTLIEPIAKQRTILKNKPCDCYS